MERTHVHWISRWNGRGWMDRWVDGWMDGAHRIIEAFCFSLSSELSSSSCLDPELSIKRLNFRSVWHEGGQVEWMDTVVCCPCPSCTGEQRALSLERVLPRAVRPPSGPPTGLTQNKSWAVSIGHPHPINQACIYVTLQAWWRPDVTKWLGLHWNAEIPS